MDIDMSIQASRIYRRPLSTNACLGLGICSAHPPSMLYRDSAHNAGVARGDQFAAAAYESANALAAFTKRRARTPKQVGFKE